MRTKSKRYRGPITVTRRQRSAKADYALSRLRMRLQFGILENPQHHLQASIDSSPPVRNTHNDRAIYQGLGTICFLGERSYMLILYSARRSYALHASSPPTSLAAPSSHPRPFAQVIHLHRSGFDHADPIGLIADLVQDIYLRELKAYKTPQVKPSDAEGNVQTFKVPQAPASPEEADIASELKSYETQAVEVEGAAGEDGAAAVEENWFEDEEETAAPAH